MSVSTDYHGSYVDATYVNPDKMAETFEKIIRFPNEKSDNHGRFQAVRNFASACFPETAYPSLLDVGSGLGVFPYLVQKNGWLCTALDPDRRAVEHIKHRLGINAICGDFLLIHPSGKFDIVTLNKVLEHVADPLSMLQKTHDWLTPKGFVYIEVPDGEMAVYEGGDREEFTIDHLHIFSFASLASLCVKAGYLVQSIIRLREPSTKYTLRAFLKPNLKQNG